MNTNTFLKNPLAKNALAKNALAKKAGLTRAAAAALGLGLSLGLLAGPAAAADRDVATERTDEVHPLSGRADDTRRLEVLHLNCFVADGDDAIRAHIGCEWRSATNDRAAGYQLWRILDRGERELVGRVGLDVTSLRDIVPAGTKAVRYAVVAVSEKGNVVGQSRVQKIVLRIDDNEQDVRPTEVDAQPVRAAAKAAWPLDVR